MVFQIDDIYKSNTPRGNDIGLKKFIWDTNAQADVVEQPVSGWIHKISNILFRDTSFTFDPNLMVITYPYYNGENLETVSLDAMTDLIALCLETVTIQGNEYLVWTPKVPISLWRGLTQDTLTIATGSGFVFTSGSLEIFLKGWKIEIEDYQ